MIRRSLLVLAALLALAAPAPAQIALGNNYFMVGDNSPTDHVWNVAIGDLVLNTDATYGAWLASTSVLNLAMPVTGAADNGSGLVRLTLQSGVPGLATGTRWRVQGIVGTTEANGTWVVTVPASSACNNCIDLQGSTFATPYVSGGGLTGAAYTLTQAGLNTQINAAALGLALQGSGSAPLSITTAVNVDLTNPLPRVLIVNATAPGVKIRLPRQNLVNSVPLGYSVTVFNSGVTNTFEVRTADGTTLDGFIYTNNSIVYSFLAGANDSLGGTWYESFDYASPNSQVTCSASQWISRLSPVFSFGSTPCTQPGFSDLSGSISAAQTAALTGDVTKTAGSNPTVLTNIPTGTTQAGTVVGTNTAAPSSPAAARVTTWLDSTDLRFHDKNAAGVVGTTIVSSTCSASNWITGHTAAGVNICAQPNFTDLAGSIAAAQTSALTGDVTKTAGSSATTLANIPNDTPVAGDLLASYFAAPATPAASKSRVWVDSTDLRLHDKNASGTVGTTVVGDSGAANNFLTAINPLTGVVSKAQPAMANISDYAATTWTPTLVGSTSGSWTLSTAVGSYEKIGRQVTLRFDVVSTSSSSPLGNVQIGGLPFAAANVANDNGYCFIQFQGGMTNSASYTTFTGIIVSNSSVIAIGESGSGVTSQNAAVARASATVVIAGFCSYRT